MSQALLRNDGLHPLPHDPTGDDSVEHEGVAVRERFRRLARRENSHRALPRVGERTNHQQRSVRQIIFPPRSVGCARVFLFQDDDFPIFGPVWHKWVRDFLICLRKSGLAETAIWKINCRADAVDPELFSEMRDAGMNFVYMGLESGTDEGLRTLNKLITVEQNVRAVEILKSINIAFDFGFMLLEPSTTFDSVFENVRFLRRIVGDGYAAAEFCRMIPYDGTPIKDQLAREGRLRGDVIGPDYAFLDPRLDTFYREINEALSITGWIHGIRALSPQLKFAWAEHAVIAQLFPQVEGLPAYRETLRNITRESNAVLFKVIEDVAQACMDARRPKVAHSTIEKTCHAFADTLYATRDAFILNNQELMLERQGKILRADRRQQAVAS